jgi:hypothetical protein
MSFHLPRSRKAAASTLQSLPWWQADNSTGQFKRHITTAAIRIETPKSIAQF